jgi:hypothetical protein
MMAAGATATDQLFGKFLVNSLLLHEEESRKSLNIFVHAVILEAEHNVRTT